jgi:hypothetical protein
MKLMNINITSIKIVIAVCLVLLCTFFIKRYYEKKSLDDFYNSFWENISSSYNYGDSVALDTDSVLLFVTKNGMVGYFCFDAFTNKTATYKYSIINAKPSAEITGYLKPDKDNLGRMIVLNDGVEDRNIKFGWFPPNELGFHIDMDLAIITNKSFKDNFTVDMTNDLSWTKSDGFGCH